MEGNKSLNFKHDDEDFVSCQICLNNFDEHERIPKYLDSCHHFFCLLCIKGLATQKGKKKVLCPTCRVSSIFTKAKFEELVTNHVALRLLKVVTEVEANIAEKEEQQQWCVECSTAASVNCLSNKHKLQNLIDFQNSCSSQVKSLSSQTNAACDEAIESYKKIQCAHQLFLSWLQLEIAHREASTTSSITFLETIKSSDAFHIPENEDVTSTFARMKQLIEQSGTKLNEVTGLQLEARNVLQRYSAVPRTIFEPIIQSDTTPNEACIHIKSSLLSLLNDEKQESVEPSRTNGILQEKANNSNNGQANFEEEPKPSCSGNQQKRPRPSLSLSLNKRSKLSPYKTTEIAPSAKHTYCYFRFQFGEIKTGNVVFKINTTSFPLMAQKFIEFCSGDNHPGYAGSQVNPVLVPGKEQLPLISSWTGGQIVDHENLLFIADVSQPVPARIGSLLFVVKEDNPWGKIVSPEFAIVMTEPSENEKMSATVFGQVENMSIMNSLANALKNNHVVTIVECGLVFI